MGKNIGVALAVAVLLIVVGAYVFYRNARPTPGPYRDSVLLSDSTPSAPSSSGSVPETAASSSARRATPVSTAPFEPRPGESLEFAANVPKLNSTIANIKLAVGDRQKFAGKTAWHFQAFAHTENPYRMVFELDDQFDSYSDAANNMSSLQYEMHLNERGQKVDSVQRMLPSERDPAPPDATAARVLPGTRDPLGMLQFLRGVDWSKTPEVRSPVFDGRKLYDVRASQIAKSAHVSVPAGNFNVQKIEIRVFEDGAEMKDAHFLLYLTNDSARTPVLMEAELPVATARVELTKAK